MADQIVQKLGMDCGDAIASINSLNGAMSKMSGGVANLGNVLASFNSQGKAFSSTMRSIASDATRAVAALEKLNGASIKAPTIPKQGLEPIREPRLPAMR